MPEHELTLLMTLNIGMTLSGILAAAICTWVITRHVTHATVGIDNSVREVAQIQREVAFMIRRQYGDIDRDLQEIKELLGGS